jgi:hypothetical protein
MKLVSDWKKALGWFSVQIPAANAALLLTWSQLPAKFQEVLPMPWVLGIAIALLVLGVLGRLVDQDKK